MLKSLTEIDFKKNVYKSRYSAVVFVADHCAPSRSFYEIFCSVAKEQKKVDFFTVNADNEESLAKEYGVETFPAVLFFERGKIKFFSYGISSKKTLENLVDRLIK